ncbi:hypothetical protein [Streptomyces sp. NPDC096339]|uniref:hypothetical protein n=1 Tax=Streptomyces sp. NPDC096339 TaxID=3366086 RepID=UPI003812E5BB
MDAQRGRTNRRRFLLIAGLPLLAVGGGMTYLLWPEPPSPNPFTVRTDAEPLNTRFGPWLGELTDPHWLGYDIDEAAAGGDRFIPGPDPRIRLVGVARLPAGGAAALAGVPGRTFTPAALPELPGPLKPHLPAEATWQHSPEFDAYANHEATDGHPTGRYLIDVARDLVCFDVVYIY